MSLGKGLPIVDSGAPFDHGRAPTHAAGPVESALIALWEETSPHFYDWRNITTMLRLRRRFDLKPVSLDGLRIAIPAGKVPDCDACLDICCTGPNAVVSLRLRDVAALMDLGRTDLITHDRPAPLPKKLARRTQSWARREADGSVFHAAFPALVRDATGTCSALSEDRTCSLWPDWPLSCARYPYALDRQNNVVFYAAGCQSTRLAPMEEAPIAVRRLVLAVVESYNQRLRDVLLLALARERLRALGLLTWIKEEALVGV